MAGAKYTHGPAKRQAAERAYTKAYAAASAADKRYSDALAKEYKGRAGDIRYQAAKQTPAIRALGVTFQKAADKQRAALDAMRDVGGSVSGNPPKSEWIPLTARIAKHQADAIVVELKRRGLRVALGSNADTESRQFGKYAVMVHRGDEDKANKLWKVIDLKKIMADEKPNPRKNAPRGALKGHRAVSDFFDTRDIDIIFNAAPARAMSTLVARTGKGFGVEHIDADEFDRRAGAASIRGIDYVNMGDPYTPTLIHDGRDFFKGAWGDFTEKYGRKDRDNPAKLPIYSLSITQAKRIPTATESWADLPRARKAALKEGSVFIGQVKDSKLRHVSYLVPTAGFSKDELVSVMREPGGGFRAHENPAIDATHQLRIQITKGKPGKGLVYAKKIGGKWHYESYGKWHLVEAWRKPEIVHGPYPTGRKNAGFSVVQGRASADVEPQASGWVVRIKGDQPKEFKSVEAAAKYARLRVHELPAARANCGGALAAEQLIAGKQSITSKLMKKLSKNPQDTAEKMYHIFHGKPATQVLEFQQREHRHEWLWAAGTLVSIVVTNGKKVMTLRSADPETDEFEDVVMVGLTEDGKQIHFVGGDQGIDLDGLMDEFGMTEDDVREHMKLGEVKQLTYRTSKNFEDKGKTDIDFYHDLGKEHAGGVLPTLIFKPLNPSLELAGGRYLVAAKDRQLGASPGITG